MDSNCKTTMCYFFNKKFLFNCNADASYMELCSGKGILIEKKTSNKLLEEAAPEILEALIIAYKWLKNKDELCEDCQNQDCVLCHEGACQGNIIKKAIEKAKGMRIEEVLNNE